MPINEYENPDPNYDKDISITYTPKLSSSDDDYGKREIYFQVSRFANNKVSMRAAANYLLNNVSDNGKHINYSNSEYDSWIIDAFKTINFYYVHTNPFVKIKIIYSVGHNPGEDEALTYHDFVREGLQEAWYNLFLTDGATQKRYIVQYCNSDNFSLKMVACDFLRNSNNIKIKNPKLLRFMIEGKIDQIEEMFQ